MPDVLQQIDQLNTQAMEELAAAKDAGELEQFRIKYLGSNGSISKGMMKLLGGVPKEQKPAVGQRANAVKTAVSAAFETRKAEIAAGGTVEVTSFVPEGRNVLLVDYRETAADPHPLRIVLDRWLQAEWGKKARAAVRDGALVLEFEPEVDVGCRQFAVALVPEGFAANIAL